MSFSEIRPYQQGDDVRFIDWNVSARVNDLHVKVFNEERELTIFVVVDTSASQAFSSTGQRKSQIATEVAALLAWSALKYQDSMGLILGGDEVQTFLPPRKGRAHTTRVISALFETQPSGGTDLGALLDFLNRVCRRRALVFLLSDFIAERYERVLRTTAMRHEVVAIGIEDLRESQLAETGLTWVVDYETHQWMEVDTSNPHLVELYQRHAASTQLQRQEMLRTLNIDSVLLSTAEPYMPKLVDLFARRRRRIR